MFRNYVLIAWRNFAKHRTFSLINVAGFALAMASCFLILFHMRSELSYEKFYPEYQNIYRLHVNEWAKSAPPTAQLFKDFFPEVRSTARFYEFGAGTVLTYESYHTIVERSLLADSTAIEMFGYEFIEGDPKTSLRVPFTSIVTESLAKRVFGNAAEAIGKTINLNGDRDLTISGVIKDMPENTHMQFDMLTAYSTMYKWIPDEWTSNRGWMGSYTYVLVAPGQVENIRSRMGDFQMKFYEGWDTPEKLKAATGLLLQPLADIHLQSHLEQEMSENSNVTYLYIFAAVALFILFIASVNFVNLNISLAFSRMKETGLRKVMGAMRPQLVKQYLAETFVLSTIALLVALALFFAAIPSYNSLAGRDVQMSDALTLENIGIMVAMVVGVSLLSGGYPALFMSRFKPTDALKSQKGPGSATPAIRKALVVFQFAVSAFMIASTIIIVRQMSFFQDQDLGFNKDGVVSVSLYGELAKNMVRNPDAVKSELLKDPAITSVARISNLPGDMISVETVRPDGADPALDFGGFRVMRIDEDALTTLQVPIVEGRDFSVKFHDSTSFILNKAAVKALNLENPVGARIRNETRQMTGTVVGVVGDYHFSSLHNAVEPLVLECEPSFTSKLLVKVNTDKVGPVISHIESTVQSIAPSNLFSYNFFDDRWNAQYKEETKMNVLFNTFSVFMIVISCIGLFGLSAITMQTRRKEIGIRKVVGASMPTIVQIMSREFVILVVVGSLIGLPLSWYAMNSWLSKFAYKIAITADVFIVSIIACVLIAFLSIFVNALKAARTNPIDSLRSE
ncbi:MAG TPA: FtsX-like permease family protein [Cyclobacteriaceae bacterium]|nr:FtsX-like permease family protein [Cyclobacteriaceae bacterium]